MIINRKRGEVEFETPAGTLRARMTMAAIQEIEARTGRGIFALAKRVTSMSASSDDMIAILHSCTLAADPKSKLSQQEVTDWITAWGIWRFVDPMTDLLSLVLEGVDPPKKAESPATSEADLTVSQ